LLAFMNYYLLLRVRAIRASYILRGHQERVCDVALLLNLRASKILWCTDVGVVSSATRFLGHFFVYFCFIDIKYIWVLTFVVARKVLSDLYETVLVMVLGGGLVEGVIGGRIGGFKRTLFL